MKRKIISRNEFRYNNTTGHPNYIFEEKEKRFHSLGITHSPFTNNKKNMLLHKNPKSGDNSISYIRYGIINDKKCNYSKKKIKNMYFSDNDFKNVKSKIRNYKKKHKKKWRTQI